MRGENTNCQVELLDGNGAPSEHGAHPLLGAGDVTQLTDAAPPVVVSCGSGQKVGALLPVDNRLMTFSFVCSGTVSGTMAAQAIYPADGGDVLIAAVPVQPKSVTTMLSLFPSVGTLEPLFQMTSDAAAARNYSLTVPPGTAGMAFSFSLEDEMSSAQLDDDGGTNGTGSGTGQLRAGSLDVYLSYGPNRATILVTAEDGVTTDRIHVTIYRRLVVTCSPMVVGCVHSDAGNDCEPLSCTVLNGSVLQTPGLAEPFGASHIVALGVAGVGRGGGPPASRAIQPVTGVRQSAAPSTQVGRDVVFDVDAISLGMVEVGVTYDLARGPTARVDVEVVCEAGHARPADYLRQPELPCEPCPAGYKNEVRGGLTCTPCAGATYDGDGAVVAGGWGSYQPSTGQVSCLACPENSVANRAQGSDTCVARPGYWGARLGDDADATTAGAGSDADADAVTTAAAAAAASTANTSAALAGLEFLRCAPEDICLGNNTCDVGYYDMLCARCVERYYRDGGNRCQECPEDGMRRILIMVGVLVGVVVVVSRVGVTAIVYIKKDVKGVMPALMFVQVVSLLSTFSFEWPPEVHGFLSFFSVFKFNLSVAQPECVSDLMKSPLAKYALLQLLPFVMLGLILVVGAYHALHARFVKACGGRWRAAMPRGVHWADVVSLRAVFCGLDCSWGDGGGKGGGGQPCTGLGALCESRPEVAAELFELWDILNTQLHTDKYEEALPEGYKVTLYTKMAQTLGAGVLPAEELSALLQRINPLRRRCRHHVSRATERMAQRFQRALYNSATHEVRLHKTLVKQAHNSRLHREETEMRAKLSLDSHAAMEDLTTKLEQQKKRNSVAAATATAEPSPLSGGGDGGTKRASSRKLTRMGTQALKKDTAYHLQQASRAVESQRSEVTRARDAAKEHFDDMLRITTRGAAPGSGSATREGAAAAVNAAPRRQSVEAAVADDDFHRGLPMVFSQSELLQQIGQLTLYYAETATAAQKAALGEAGGARARKPWFFATWGASCYHWGTASRSHAELVSFSCSMVSLFVMVLLIMYIPLAESTLQPFSCRKGEDRVWRMTSPSASDVVCSWDDPTWRAMVRISYAGISTWIVGMPAFLAATLWVGYRLAHGHDTLCFRASEYGGMNDIKFEQTMGPLYVGYHMHACLWEIWLMLWKLGFVMAAGFLQVYPDLQLCVTIMLITSALGMHLSFMPFVSRLEHRLELAGRVLHALIVMAGAVFMSDSLAADADATAQDKKTREAFLISFVIVIVMFGVVLNAGSLFWNIALVFGNLSGDFCERHLPALPRFASRCARCLTTDIVRPFARAREKPSAERLALLPRAMRQIHRVFGAEYAEAIKPWVQKGEKAHIQRCLTALNALEAYHDNASYSVSPAVDGARLAIFLAGAPRQQREALVLTFVEQHNWLMRAQKLRAVETYSRKLRAEVGGADHPAARFKGKVAEFKDVVNRLNFSMAVNRAVSKSSSAAAERQPKLGTAGGAFANLVAARRASLTNNGRCDEASRGVPTRTAVEGGVPPAVAEGDEEGGERDDAAPEQHRPPPKSGGRPDGIVPRQFTRSALHAAKNARDGRDTTASIEEEPARAPGAAAPADAVDLASSMARLAEVQSRQVELREEMAHGPPASANGKEQEPGLRFEIDDDAANDAALLQALGDRSGSPAVALTTEEIELLSA